MTSPLDDALNSSSPAFHSPELYVDWRELPDQAASTNSDSPRDLSSQVGKWTVEHSLDDGLPDAVTMTSGADAVGVLKVDLAGRESAFADVVGWRTSTTGTGSGTTVTPSLATGATWDDYCIVAVTFNNFSVAVQETSGRWELLAVQNGGSVGTGIITYVYGARWYGTLTGPVLSWTGTFSYSWVSSAAYAESANGFNRVVIRPDSGNIVYRSEDTPGTNHSAGTIFLRDRRGWIVGVWSSLSATAQWTPPAGHTELQEAAAVVDVMMSTSPVMLPSVSPVPGIAATTTPSTGLAVMVAISLRVHERQPMSARQLFSPYNTDSPFYGFDRDTAGTEFTFNVITEEGVVGTTLHKGQMSGVPVQGQTASLESVSKSRLDMQAMASLPRINGTTSGSGLSLDWLNTFMLARGGKFIGPAPSRFASYWNPYYGSLRGAHTGVYNREWAGQWNTVVASQRYQPVFVPGPWFLAAWAKHDGAEVIENRVEFSPATEPLPHQIQQNPNWRVGGMLTSQESAGRISFWLRGDPVTPGVVNGSGDFLMNYFMDRYSPTGARIADVTFLIRSDTRQFVVGFDGVNFFFNIDIPADGEWHFCGLRWNYLTRQCQFRRDNLTLTPSPSEWAPVDITNLPATNAQGEAAGGRVRNWMRSEIPIADLQLEVGIEAYNDGWSAVYPPTNNPASFTAISKPTNVAVQAAYNSVPFVAWEGLSEVARAGLMSYRANEDDFMEVVPMDYFGEADMMTPQPLVVDTEINAADPDIYHDPTRLRNVVTVKYKEARVDSGYFEVYRLTETITLPRGVTTITFPLAVPIVEIAWEGVSGPPYNSASYWMLENLTASHASGATVLPPYRHYFFVNTKSDGTGTYLPFKSVEGKLVMNSDASSITVQFTNRTAAPVYITNNGSEKPFLFLRGTGVREVDAYVTMRDEASVMKRGERPIEVEVPWVQNRTQAQNYANRLLTAISVPRGEITVTAMGDPRRKPGQLFMVEDREGASLTGTWRAVSIANEGEGAKFIQTMRLIEVYPVALWSQKPGWNQASWGE